MVKVEYLSLFWFWCILIPGLIFIWLRIGFRGRNISICLWESLLSGMAITSLGALTVLLFCILFWEKNDAVLFLTAVLNVNKVGINGVFQWNQLGFLYLSLGLFLTYVYSFLFGIGFRRITESGLFTKRKPRITPDSVLDKEIVRFREERKIPFVTVHLKSGVKIQGECVAYTFSEPREMVLKADGKTFVIFLGAEIITVQLE